MDLIVLTRPVLNWSKAKEVYLFGSYARGEMNEESDINIEIIGSNKSKEEIEYKLEKITNKVCNVLFAEEKISNKFRQEIDEEKFLIYGG